MDIQATKVTRFLSLVYELPAGNLIKMFEFLTCISNAKLLTNFRSTHKWQNIYLGVKIRSRSTVSTSPLTTELSLLLKIKILHVP